MPFSMQARVQPHSRPFVWALMKWTRPYAEWL
jgi:hypothetical protein